LIIKSGKETVERKEMFDKLKALNAISFDLMESLDEAEGNAYKLANELENKYKEEELTECERRSVSAAYHSVMDIYRRAEG